MGLRHCYGDEHSCIKKNANLKPFTSKTFCAKKSKSRFTSKTFWSTREKYRVIEREMGRKGSGEGREGDEKGGGEGAGKGAERLRS